MYDGKTEEVGGLTEELAVAFNDIDFCMKVRQKGYLVVYNPYAELYHYESKSRGLEDTPEKQERFHKEIQTFETRWPEILKNILQSELISRDAEFLTETPVIPEKEK